MIFDYWAEHVIPVAELTYERLCDRVGSNTSIPLSDAIAEVYYITDVLKINVGPAQAIAYLAKNNYLELRIGEIHILKDPNLVD